MSDKENNEILVQLLEEINFPTEWEQEATPDESVVKELHGHYERRKHIQEFIDNLILNVEQPADKKKGTTILPPPKITQERRGKENSQARHPTVFPCTYRSTSPFYSANIRKREKMLEEKIMQFEVPMINDPLAPESTTFGNSLGRQGRQQKRLAQYFKTQLPMVRKGIPREFDLSQMSMKNLEQQGVYSLIDRGFIPHFANISPSVFETRPILKAKSMNLFPFEEQFHKVDWETSDGIYWPSIKLEEFSQSRIFKKLQKTPLAPWDIPDWDKVPSTRTLTYEEGDYEYPNARPNSPLGPSLRYSATFKHSLRKIDSARFSYKWGSSASEGSRNIYIINGVIVDKSPIFNLFLLKNWFQWGQVKLILQSLERICREFAIIYLEVDCEKLERLCENGMKCKFYRRELIQCVTHSEEVLALISKPGQRYRGIGGVEAGAIKIQSTWRMLVLKKEYKYTLMKVVAGRIFYRRWRRVKVIKAWKKKNKEQIEMHLKVAKELSENLHSRWKEVESKERIYIHLPSLSLFQRCRHESLKGSVREWQSFQFSRISDLLDPLISVIYVTNDSEGLLLFEHFRSILAHYNSHEDLQRRLHILNPECACYFPPDACITAMLLASKKSLAQIKSLTQGKEAIIIPSMVGPNEIILSSILQIPLLNWDFEKATYYTGRLGRRELIQASSVFYSPGIEISSGKAKNMIFSIFYRTFLKYPQVRRWHLHLNDELIERYGVAYYDLEPHDVQHLRSFETESKGMEWLSHDMASRVKILNTSAYPSWTYFLLGIHETGCTLEPKFPNVQPSFGIHSFLWITPGGSIRMVGTGEALFLKQHHPIGTLFPQKSLPINVIEESSMSIAQVCFEKELYGYLDIEFEVYLKEDDVDIGKESTELEYLLLAVNASPCCTMDYSHCLSIPFLLGSSWDNEKGKWYQDYSKKLFYAQSYISKLSFFNMANVDRSKYLPSPVKEERAVFISPYLEHELFWILPKNIFHSTCLANDIAWDEYNGKGIMVFPFELTDKTHRTMVCAESDIFNMIELFRRTTLQLQEILSLPEFVKADNFQLMYDALRKWMVHDYYRNEYTRNHSCRVSWKHTFAAGAHKDKDLLWHSNSPLFSLLKVADVTTTPMSPKPPILMRTEDPLITKEILNGRRRVLTPSLDASKTSRPRLSGSAVQTPLRKSRQAGKSREESNLDPDAQAEAENLGEVETLLSFATEIIDKIHVTVDVANKTLDLFQENYAANGRIEIPENYQPEKPYLGIHLLQEIMPENVSDFQELAAKDSFQNSTNPPEEQ